jgi:lactate 2-monooxygenase
MELSALDWQKEIYLNGFAGISPQVNVDLSNLEANAKTVLSPQAFAYVAGGAGLESTLFANRSAFERIRIVPRMLRDVGERDISISHLAEHFQRRFYLPR